MSQHDDDNPLDQDPLIQAHASRFTTLQEQHLPSAGRTIARLIILILLLLTLFMAFVPWVQTAVGTGSVTALNPEDRAQQLHALVAGRIKRWHVREGSTVQKGDPILELVDIDSMLIERLKAERDALEQNYQVAKIAAETAKINYDRQRRLYQDGLTSRQAFEDTKIKYKTLLAKEAKALAELKKSEVKLSRQASQTLHAPRDGTIISILAGDTSTTVKEGESVATFIPKDVTPAVELYVDGLNIPLIQPGRKVRLEFEGWPAVQFSGWPSTAVGTFGGVVKTVDPSISRNGLFRIMIVQDPDSAPWPDDRFLRFGAKVKGWVLLDTVSVGYELWRQLNNFPPRFDQRGTQQQADPNA
jgi:RND family efflux transporter MFP subunit